MVARPYWKSAPSLNFTVKSDCLNVATRAARILPHYIGSKFLIHNGKNFTTLLITTKLIGYKFGDFSFTKKSGKTN